MKQDKSSEGSSQRRRTGGTNSASDRVGDAEFFGDGFYDVSVSLSPPNVAHFVGSPIMIDHDADGKLRAEMIDDAEAKLAAETSQPTTRQRPLSPKTKELLGSILLIVAVGWLLKMNSGPEPRPPFYAEYLLYFLLGKSERETIIGDLQECYGKLMRRFGKRAADLWYYKQVVGSVWPLLRRAVLKFGALVWLGRMLRRLIS